MRTVIEITVNLQKPMQYSLLALIIALLIAFTPLIWKIIKYLIEYFKTGEKTEKVKEVKEEPFVPRKSLFVLKDEYLRIIDAIETKYNNGEIDTRELHLQLSSTVKKFIYEVTGVKTQAFVLSDFERNKMPEMQALLEIFYAPEFAPESVIQQRSADNARKVVREWN